LVFRAVAILDYKPFIALCPRPTPPEVMKRGGEKSVDTDDPKYGEAISKWATQKTNWMVLQSLLATEGLEFETVKEDDPETWNNYHKEFAESGFTESEINRIVNLVINVNGLDQSKIDEATERFLSVEAEAQESE
jgi:hypothetical protein